MLKNGFSLLELVITTIIIAILASISYPLYLQHLVKVRRTEARTALYELAQQLEQYYAENSSYEGATLAKLLMPKLTEHGFYALNIAVAEQGNSYQVNAVPQATQATQDSKCGTLSLDALGKQGISGSGTISECWQ